MAHPDDFDVWDYVVFSLVLLLSVGVGLLFAFVGGRQKTVAEYILGDKSLSLFPVLVSMLTSFTTVQIILGSPAEIYTQGMQFWMSIFGSATGILAVTAIWLPLMYPLDHFSIYHYLERRFQSKAARFLGSSLGIINMVLNGAVSTYAPAQAFEAMIDFPKWGTFLIMCGGSTIYTVAGGLKSVTWASTLSFFFIIGSYVMIIVKGTVEVGSVSEVFDINEEYDRTDLVTWDIDPTVRTSVWAVVCGSFAQAFFGFGLFQPDYQLYKAVPSMRRAKIAQYITSFLILITLSMPCYIGLVMFAYFEKINCNPLQQGLVESPNGLTPYLVMELFDQPGVRGFYMATVILGGMGLTSVCINSGAAMIWTDLMEWKFPLEEESRTKVIKALAVIMGGGMFGMSFVVDNLEGTVQQTTISLAVAPIASAAGMIFLGAIFPWANAWGAIVGGIVSFGIRMWLVIGSYDAGIDLKPMPYPDGTTCELVDGNLTLLYSGQSNVTLSADDSESFLDWIYDISFFWYGWISVLTVVIVGLPVSFLTGANRFHDVPTKFVVPVSRLLCCVPEKYHYKLNCSRYFEDPLLIKEEEEPVVQKDLNRESNHNGESIGKSATYDFGNPYHEMKTRL